MTTAAGRRLTKLENALRPREAVLAWLGEVQELPDINEYSRHVAEVPIDAAPMSVIGRRVDAAVREDMRSASQAGDGPTPEDLARSLGLRDAKRVRAFLRARYPRPTSELGTRWCALTPEMERAVRDRFRVVR